MELMHSVSTSVAVAVAKRVNLLFPWRTCCLREEEETAAAKAAAEPTALTAAEMPLELPADEGAVAAGPLPRAGIQPHAVVGMRPGRNRKGLAEGSRPPPFPPTPRLQRGQGSPVQQPESGAAGASINGGHI